MRSRRVVIRAMALAVLALSAVPGPASAKPQLRTNDPSWKLYRDIYHAAETNMELGRWEDALTRLDALLGKRVDTASVRYYRALCLANLRRWAEAYEDFARAFSMGDPASADDVAIAKECYKKMAEVKKRLGWLRISVGPLPEGERPVVTIDGEPAPAAKDPHRPAPGNALVLAPVPVLRGEHTVEVVVKGREPMRQRVVVETTGETTPVLGAFHEPLVAVDFWPTPSKPDGARALLGASPAKEASGSAAAASAGSTGASGRVPFYLASAGLALGATSAGLLTAHALDGSAGRGDRLLVAGGVTGAAALVSGLTALLLGGGKPDARAAGGRALPGVATDARAAGGRALPGVATGATERAGGRLMVAPTPQGGGVVWAGAF